MSPEQYIHSIRNPRKRSYARLWWAYLTNQIADRPYALCSPMAAQAVRMRFAELAGNDPRVRQIGS